MAHPSDFDFYCEEALSGKTRIKKVYESENVLAFYHTKPKFATHIVIIPKEHIHDLRTIKLDIGSEIMSVAAKLFEMIDIDHDGGRLVTNLGKFQDTPHLHFHFISDGSYQNLIID